MKNIAVTILIVLVVGSICLYLISFQVRETELALVTTFGEPTRVITEPGWRFKWPIPIERVHKFDSRMKAFEGDLVETTTKGAVPIIVNTYAVWKVKDPLAFFNANNGGSVRDLESKLRSQIYGTQNKVVGRHYFSEFVNSDPSQIRFKQIEEEMHTDLQGAIADANYGVEVLALGMKQLKISEEVSQDVFNRMRQDRERETKRTIAEGNAEATAIKTDADSKKTELLAAAKARAKAIRGQGDAEAAKYYEMLQADPELAMFLRNIEAFVRISEEKTTFVIPADTEPFSLLRERPEIAPRGADKSQK